MYVIKGELIAEKSVLKDLLTQLKGEMSNTNLYRTERQREFSFNLVFVGSSLIWAVIDLFTCPTIYYIKVGLDSGTKVSLLLRRINFS